MQTIREDSNTNYDEIFLGYWLPEMGDQSLKAKRTREICNILDEHDAKMQQLKAEGKLPKKKRRVEQSESSEEVTSSSESSGNEGKRRVKNSARKKVKLGPRGFYYDK
ncbi:hypothetical protein TVAG_439870 [Trichomonas vaginalis G3]|uniref:Uncharacterized protein n=1 Tax=Trichomonas vaginalis (strain ATCC PRA-98 / G3) TaxID=412133 RepID=A2G0E4_TRIV3|nr:hypothetical protein TVAG_439870 [Trichomonas vaginalis G3]|eukprot:XP_001302297.1 hypothetical protein [Trichomonas vaginalis G3]